METEISNLPQIHFYTPSSLINIIGNAIKEGNTKKVFPTILQAVESTLILEKCARQINLTYPELPFVTIHDSVVCDFSFATGVKKIMNDILHQSVGAIPGLKIELMDKVVALQNIQNTVDEDWEEIIRDVDKIKVAPGWVGSFTEEPKEIPLLSTMIKLGGKIHLDKRMLYPEFEFDYEDYEDNRDESEYQENNPLPEEWG